MGRRLAHHLIRDLPNRDFRNHQQGHKMKSNSPARTRNVRSLGVIGLLGFFIVASLLAFSVSASRNSSNASGSRVGLGPEPARSSSTHTRLEDGPNFPQVASTLA